MNITPIRTEEDYRTALHTFEALGDPEEGTEEYDHLDVLATLIEAYEDRHHPIGPPDPISAIEYELEKRGLTRKDLEPVIGPSGRVSEVLNRQRPLTVTMIRNLYAAFQIRPDILFAPYQTSKDAAPKSGRPSGK